MIAKNLKSSVARLFAALPFLCLAAAAPIGADVTAERYPDADSVLVDGLEDVAYRADGTSETTEDQWTKILTEKGRRGESVFQLDYNARYGTASVVRVSAIAADGVEREIDVSATTREATDNSSMGSNIYDPLDRRITCTIPGLKIGEIVHVRTRRKTFKSRMQDNWADMSVFEWTCPIVRSSLRVRAPAARPLKSVSLAHPLGNVVSNVVRDADGSLVYTWTATNSPQAFPEPDMPPLHTQVQALHVSTVASWRDVSSWYWNLCAPHLAKTNAAMVAKVREVVGTLEGEDRIRAVYKWVSQEVRYMGLTLEDKSPGYAPHDVCLTFDNRYGVCRDKAALLVAMLRLAGVEAYPVLIRVGAKMNPASPSPYFNHAIVAVGDGGGWRLMDPTDESSRDLMPAYLSDCSYVVATPEGDTLRTSPVVPVSANELKVDATGEVSPDGSGLLAVRLSCGGINDTVFRHSLLRRKPEERRQMFEKMLRERYPDARLAACSIEPRDLRDTDRRLEICLTVRLGEMALDEKTCKEVKLPLVTPTVGIVNWLLRGSTSLETRKYPLVFSTTACMTETLKLKLCDQFGEVASLPEERRIDGKYSYWRDCYVQDGNLVANRRVALSALEFSPAEYAALREDLKRVEAAEREWCVFGRNVFANADAHIFCNRCDAAVTGPREWVVTNELCWQVLTYDGKKRSSEIKYSFNPTWQDVRVAEAVVSNLDGKVSRVTDREINVMDCSWASKAPRYPAGKQLVVNLPSVEIGSVVRTKVVTSVRGAPHPFYRCFAFDSHSPTDEISARVGDWSRKVVNPEVLPDEPMQPDMALWRDCEVVSLGGFDDVADGLAAAADVEPLESEMTDIAEIRNWMARNVRVCGPSLYDLRIADQLTDPSKVIAERYATRLDYVRTLCALLRGAGYDADIVFAADDALKHPETRRMNRIVKPKVTEYDLALCRVRERVGGFLFFGGETRECYLGTENEYTPIGATAHEGASWYDPKKREFGVVTIDDGDFSDFALEEDRILVRENGSVDIETEATLFGSGVGPFRRRYAEMLPEERDRHHQALLAKFAQAASATREMETDVTNYPAVLRLATHIPDFARVDNGMLTLTLNDFTMPIFNLSGAIRKSPIAVGGAVAEETQYEIVLPEGYDEIEHLPQGFEFRNPKNPGEVWYHRSVTTARTDGRLVVKVVDHVAMRADEVVDAAAANMLLEWVRRYSSRANLTIAVRRRMVGGDVLGAPSN